MFIVYGTRVFKSVLVKNINRQCNICDNSTFTIIKYRRWATLFFIPIFPISGLKHFIMCEKCNNGYEIDKQMANQYI